MRRVNKSNPRILRGADQPGLHFVGQMRGGQTCISIHTHYPQVILRTNNSNTIIVTPQNLLYTYHKVYCNVISFHTKRIKKLYKSYMNLYIKDI